MDPNPPASPPSSPKRIKTQYLPSFKTSIDTILETLAFIKTEAYSHSANTRDLQSLLSSDRYSFLYAYLDTSPVITTTQSLLTAALARLTESLSLIAKIEDLLEEIRMICGHVFHVKQQKILFEVFLLLDNVLECPCQEAFSFLKGFTEQVATLKGCLEEMEQRLKAVGKGVKKENLFVLAEKEVERFCYGYVEKQLYWHLRYYWDLLTEWMEDFQTEIAVKAGFMGVDCSDGLHPVKIQNLVMKALSYLTMMRTNYFGLRDMLIEIIDKKGRGEGKFLRGFEDDKEKELVLYAITLGIPENYSKELCGLLPLYKEVKMYKQVRYLKSIREFKEPLGDIYEGTIEARNFMALLKSFD